MYPEGRLTSKMDLGVDEFKTGAARLALTTPGITVVPLAQWGAKPGRWRAYLSFITRRRAHFLMGDPIDLTPWEGRTDAEAVNEVTKHFRTTIIDLLQELQRDLLNKH